MATGLERSVFIPIPKKGDIEEYSNYHITALISHASRLCSKSFKLGFSSLCTEKFQVYKLGFKEAEEPEIKLPTFARPWRKQGTFSKTSTSAS